MLTRRTLIQGFPVGDPNDRHAAFLAGVSRWLREGRLKCREDVVEGLADAPRAFLGLFAGQSFGKLPVKVREPG